MIVYWSPKGQIYEEYKEKLLQISPFYRILFLIIEKKDDDFCENFQSIMSELEETYDTRYKCAEMSEDFSSNLLFVMLLAALKTNQRRIIDFILNYDNFETIEFEFSENIIPEEIHYYTALKLLKQNHEIGRNKIPKEWLTKEVLEEFFDSQITYYNQDLIEISCNCMLHSQSQKIIVKSEKDVTDSMVMWDDTDSLEYLIGQENLKRLILHPVIETYINLKSLKYQRIFTWNFWAFVWLFIIPFTLLITQNHMCTSIQSTNTTNSTEQISENCSFKDTWNSIIKHLHIIGLIYIFIREGFQLKISKSCKSYFLRLSNIFDITLIFLSLTLSISSLSEKVGLTGGIRTSLEVAFILFTTISATSILPFAHVPMNMQILKKVALTFLRIFYTFAIILIAFSFSFCIMFEEDNKYMDANPDKDHGERVVLKNFNLLPHSLIKIITMVRN